jgi:hypothetical protein
MADTKKEAFYKKYYSDVVKATEGTGLFPEMVIAQMALESSWGESGLATKANNMFGVKSHGEKGGIILQNKKEGKDKSWKKYGTPLDSIKGYVKFLQDNPRYEKGGVFNANTPQEQAKLLQKAGYAGDSTTYANKIIGTLENKENANYVKSLSTEKTKPGYDAQGKELTKEEKQLESYQNIQDEFPGGEYGRGGDVYVLPDGRIFSYDGKMGTYDRELKRPKWTHTSYTAGKDWRGTPGYEERQAKKDENIKLKSEEQADIDKYGKKGTLITEGENRGGTRYSDRHYKDIYGDDVYEGRYTLSDEERAEQNKKEEGVNIQDLTEPESKTTTGAIKEGDSRQDIEKRIQDNKDILNNLGNRPKFVHDYAPDQQQNTNLAGNIVDAGRGVIGMMGANTEVPVYQRGSMFQTSMDELTQRRNMGLTDTEKDFARNMAERGYGYDVKNIAKFSGGSAGVALGNLGRATGQLYDEYGKLAVRDEGVRRQNRADFNRGALSDEQVNRQIFTDELRQVEMTKQAGAALVQDATKNIRDRAQYEKAYGKGSQMYEYMKTLDRDKKESMFNQEAADARRVEDIGKTSQRAIDADEKLLQKYGAITPGTVLGDAPTATEGFKTVEELQQMKKEGVIEEDVYQEKLRQQPDDTTMPDDYIYPTAANSKSDTVETVRNVSNAPRADDYNEGIVGVDAKRPKSAIVDAIEAETTPVPDLATQGIVDEEVTSGLITEEDIDATEANFTGEVADDFVYPTAANPNPTNSNTTEKVANVVDKKVESAPKVNSEWDAKYDKATEKEREKMLDEMPKEFDAASFSDETEPEDNIKDYEAELEQNPETLKRYKEDPIAFLEDDIKGWESEPDSKKKTKSLKNLKKNLKYLKSLKKK